MSNARTAVLMPYSVDTYPGATLTRLPYVAGEARLRLPIGGYSALRIVMTLVSDGCVNITTRGFSVLSILQEDGYGCPVIHHGE